MKVSTYSNRLTTSLLDNLRRGCPFRAPSLDFISLPQTANSLRSWECLTYLTLPVLVDFEIPNNRDSATKNRSLIAQINADFLAPAASTSKPLAEFGLEELKVAHGSTVRDSNTSSDR